MDLRAGVPLAHSRDATAPSLLFFPLWYDMVHAQSLSHVELFESPWTVVHQAPLSMGFPRQEYWVGLPFLPPGDLPDPGIKLTSPGFAGRFFTT